VLRGLLSGFWIITVNPGYLSCISNAVSLSSQLNLTEIHCCFKSTIKKLWMKINTCKTNWQEAMQRVMDAGLTRPTQKTAHCGIKWYKAVLLAILCPSTEFWNFWICLLIRVSLLS
jgi:hypothetical protein